MSLYGHRTLLSGRIPELLENLKSEFETLAHEVNVYKMQKDDYERKLQGQLTELSNIQNTLFELERTHTKLKQQYEDEILRLRRQMDLTGVHQEGSASRPLNSASNNSGPTETEKNQLPNGPSFYSQGNSLATLDKRRFGSSPSPTANNSIATPPPNSLGNKRPRSSETETGPSSVGLGVYNQQPNFPALSPLPPPPGSLHESDRGAKHLKSEKDERGFPLSVNMRDTAKEPPRAIPSLLDRAKEITPSVASSSAPSPATQTHPPVFDLSKRTNEPEETASSSLGSGSTNLHNNSSNSNSSSNSRSGAGPSKENSSSNGNSSEKVDGGQPKKNEWIVGYNPSVQTILNVDLAHTLDHSSVVCCVKFSNDGKYLATGCNRSTQIYNSETGEKIKTFSDNNAKDGDLYIRSVCFSPDGNFLAAGAEDKTVKVWDIDHNRVTQTFTGHELDIYSLDWSSDGRFIVSGSGDKKTKIWDREKGKSILTLGNEEVGPKDGVTSVAISPDGRLVAAGSLDRIVRLWDAHTGYFLERFEGHLDSVYSVAFSPDGKSLASGSLDKTLKLWDLSGSRSRSRCRATFSGHKDFVLSVAFSGDGNWLVSGSKDRTVQFWDPRSAVTYMMLQGHKNSVISVALSPVGGMFATGSGDFLARLWRYDSCYTPTQK